MSGFEEPVDLAYIGEHWGGPYKLSYSGGLYRAVRADDGTELAAGTADALLVLIRADYAAKPVPRKGNSTWLP